MRNLFLALSLLLFSSLVHAASYVSAGMLIDMKTITVAFTDTQTKGWQLVVATLASFGVIILFRKVVARAG